MNRAAAGMLALLTLASWACDDGTGVEPETGLLVGTWLSAGNDVAPAMGARDSVVAEFGEDGTWGTFEYPPERLSPFAESGVYELGDSVGSIRSITLLGHPSRTDTIFAGIFRVAGDRLQLEIVRPGQYTPATPADGFGSTLDDGVETGAYWIQIFERTERED